MRQFHKNTDGNVVMTFALCLFPLMILVGFFADFGRQETQEQKTVAALDYAVLATAKAFQDNPNLSEPELEAIAQNFFNADVQAPESMIYDDLVLTLMDDEIVVNVTGEIQTSIMGIIGFDELKVSAESGAGLVASSPLEMVIVADVSNSMQGPGITGLRSAANALLDELYASTNPDVKVGLVPFNQYVHIGTGITEPWLQVPSDKTSTSESCSTDQTASKAIGCSFQQTCVESGLIGGGQENCRTNTVCPSGVDAIRVCQDVTRTETYFGCVRSRHPAPANAEDGNYDDNPIIGELFTNRFICHPENIVVPLSPDAQVIRDALSALNPDGNTYIPTGLIWGLRVLSPIEPYSQSTLPVDNQALVLISDGANTRSINGNGHHYGSNLNAANNLTLEVCDAIKDAGIAVYTVDFGIDDMATEQLLKDCATDSTHNFEADTTAQLRNTFLQISSRFNEVKLSR